MKIRLELVVVLLLLVFRGEPCWGGERQFWTVKKDWTYVSVGDGKDRPVLRDLFASKDQMFAVGDKGTFCRYADGKLTIMEAPTTEDLHVVWGKGPTEIYAAGEAGTVLHFDGKTLHLVGQPVKTVKRQYHPEIEAKETQAKLRYIWASSPKDIYVAGQPAVFLHYDGTRWQEIDIGAKQVIVPDQTRLTRHVATPRIGPIWGTAAGDVWVRKDVVVKNDQLNDGHAVCHVVMQFQGKAWRTSGGTLPDLRYDEGRFPEVLAVSPSAIWTRIEDRLYKWDQGRRTWHMAHRLPEERNASWSDWTAAVFPAPGGANPSDVVLVYNWKDGFRVLAEGAYWLSVPGPVPQKGSFRKVVLTEDGVIGCLSSWDEKSIFLRK